MKASLAALSLCLLFASCGGQDGTVLATRVGLKMEEMMTVITSINDVETAMSKKPEFDRIKKELAVLTGDLPDLSTSEREEYESVLKGRLAEMSTRLKPLIEKKRREISPEVHREIDLVMKGAVPLK